MTGTAKVGVLFRRRRPSRTVVQGGTLMGKSRVVLGLALALALGLVLALPGGLDAARKANRPHIVTGTVVSVHHGKGNKNGSGIIRVRARAKNRGNAVLGRGQSGTAHTVTIHVNQGTTFARIAGKKNGQQAPARFAHLRAGQHVRIKLDGGRHASEVKIIVRRKAGKIN